MGIDLLVAQARSRPASPPSFSLLELAANYDAGALICAPVPGRRGRPLVRPSEGSRAEDQAHSRRHLRLLRRALPTALSPLRRRQPSVAPRRDHRPPLRCLRWFAFVLVAGADADASGSRPSPVSSNRSCGQKRGVVRDRGAGDRARLLVAGAGAPRSRSSGRSSVMERGRGKEREHAGARSGASGLAARRSSWHGEGAAASSVGRVPVRRELGLQV
jgi:hypothetical protein